MDDWNGVELGPEVIALALVPARFNNCATQAGQVVNEFDSRVVMFQKRLCTHWVERTWVWL